MTIDEKFILGLVMFFIFSLLIYHAEKPTQKISYKYIITILDSPGVAGWAVNSYKKINNGKCIEFKNDINKKVTFCGTYQIEEIN